MYLLIRCSQEVTFIRRYFLYISEIVIFKFPKPILFKVSKPFFRNSVFGLRFILKMKLLCQPGICKDKGEFASQKSLMPIRIFHSECFYHVGMVFHFGPFTRKQVLGVCYLIRLNQGLHCFMIAHVSRLPNDPMLNIWLNMKKKCSMKRIENRGMSCNSLWIPTLVI